MLTESWVEGKSLEEKDAQPTERTTALWGLSSKIDSRIWVNLRITGLVFRSARFATYFTILSVKFEPLCIRPIMSAKADKGDRKREIEQSPMKKKFRDSAISSEDLDSAIASRIELAFKEHQNTLNSVVNSAVRDAMDSVLIPALRELREDILATNKSVKELREEFEAIVTKTKQTRDRVDSVQAAAREDKRTVTDLKDQLERLTEMTTDMEDRCRRNNVRLVGLPEGMEGPDAFSELIFQSGFLPWGAVTLRLIGRIACMTEGGAPIGRALWSSVYWDGMTDQISWKVLGRRIRWSAHRTMSHCCFFLTLVRLQRSGERHLVRFWRRWLHLVSSPSSSIQRWLSYGTKGNREATIPLRKRRILSVPCLSRSPMPQHYGGMTGEQRPLFLQFHGRGVTAGMDLALAAQKGMIAGWTWMLAKPIVCVFFSYTGILSLFIRYNDLFAGKTDTPFFCFGGD